MKGKYWKEKGTIGQIFFLPNDSRNDDWDQMEKRADLAKNPDKYERARLTID
jgi:hypothetical protein